MGWFKRLFTEQDSVEVAKPAPKKRAPRRNFDRLYPIDASIEILVTENPKRQGTEARKLYEHYKTCFTIGECLSAGMTYRIIDGDVRRGYIDVVVPYDS